MRGTSTPVPTSGQRNGVTIGIPVFNEQDRIERAIRCAAPQCERLVVADNASTDATETICRRLATEYTHLEYVRHEQNMGSLENWHFLLSVTDSPYFMTLGSHDYIDANYIDTLLAIMLADDSVIVAVGNLCFEYEEGSGPNTDEAFNAWEGGIQENAAARVRSFIFDDAQLAWLMQGLFRTHEYKTHFTRDLPPYGIDAVFLATILQHGKIVVSPATRYHAWIRHSKGNHPSYLERLIGKKSRSSKRNRMRNNMRAALYKVLLGSEEPSTLLDITRLRFQVMTRLGTFKLNDTDPMFYLLYIPVKLARKLRRLF